MKQKFLKVCGGVVALSVAATTQVMAAVPAAVTTALGDAATDAATIGGLALVAIIAAVGLKYARRAL